MAYLEIFAVIVGVVLGVTTIYEKFIRPKAKSEADKSDTDEAFGLNENELKVLGASWDLLHEAYWGIRPLLTGYSASGGHQPEEIKKAHKKYVEFGSYFDKNKIFLRGELKDKFSEIDGRLSKAINNLLQHTGSDSEAIAKESSGLTEEVKELIRELEPLVQRRLDQANENDS